MKNKKQNSKIKKDFQKTDEEINKLETEIAELKVGWQRTQADFENFRNRTASEKAELIKYANADLIEQILPVIDNFERALEHKPELLSHPEQPVTRSFSEVRSKGSDSNSDSSVLPQNDIKKVNEYLKGLEYTKIQLEQILQANGVEKINIKAGDKFDPNIAEATQSIEDKKYKSDHIIKILQSGYKLGDKVLRPAKVVVVK